MPTDPPPPPGTTLEPPSPLAATVPPPPPGTTLEPPQPGQPPQPSGEYDAPTAITRSLAKGAIGVVDFIPDMLVYAHNAVVPTEDKFELPSSYLNRKLDEQLTPPTSGAMKASEEVTGALAAGGASGAASLGRAALPMAKKVASLAEQGVAAAGKQLSRVTTRAAEEAHIAGYKLPPSYIGGPGRKTVQTMAGGPKVEKDFSKDNEIVTDNLAKLALGLHPEEELDEATFETLKDEAYQSYRKVAELGQVPADGQYIKDVMNAGGRFANRGESFGNKSRFPEIDAEKQPYYQEHFDANHALDEIRMLRKLSRDNLKQYNPGANALGLTQREIANAMENRLDRYANEIGKPELVKELRAARTQLAKIASVEDSMGAGGHVRAEDFKRMLDKSMPLSGSLLTIAETAKNFPKAVQELTAGETGVFSAVDYLLGGSGVLAGHPAVAMSSLARPISRWALKTEGAQKAMMQGLRKPAKKSSKVARDALDEVRRTLKEGGRSAVTGGSILGSESAEEGM